MIKNNYIISPEEYAHLAPIRHEELTVVLNKVNSRNSVQESTSVIQALRINPDEEGELYCHNSFDVVYAANCDITISICDTVLTLRKQCMIFIAPGIPYSISVPGDGMVPVFTIETGAINTHFHRICRFNSMLSKFFADAIWGEFNSMYLMFNRINNSNVHSVLRLLINEELIPAENSADIKTALFLCACGYLGTQHISTYEMSQSKITKSEQINKILTYIRDNYRTVTLERLAESFHYTVPYVSKLIRSATGMTFTEILREIKFDVCRSLLVNSDLKINRIAEIAGFQNTDHFNRIFKKRMGETPTEYKKNKSQEE